LTGVHVGLAVRHDEQRPAAAFGLIGSIGHFLTWTTASRST
jgi:hypothetical protein